MTGTEVGNEMQNALDEATENAARRLGQTIESEMTYTSERAQDELKDIGTKDRFTNIQKSVMAKAMNNWKVVKQEIVPEKLVGSKDRPNPGNK